MKLELHLGELLSAFRSSLTHNLGLKLFSLLTAIVLFSFIRGSESAQRAVFVDVVALLPEDSSQMLVSELPDQVRITIEGSRSQVNGIRPGSIAPVQIDLSDTTLRYYYFSESEFSVPAGVRVRQVAPASIPLRWAARARRTLRVQPSLVGTPEEGLVLGAPAAVSPTDVQVEGPEQDVSSLRRLVTEEIDLATLGVGQHRRTVPLARLPAHVRYVPDEPVEVTINVVRDLVEESFPVAVVVENGPLGEPESVAVETVVVTVRGIPAAVGAVDPARLQSRLDTTTLVPSATPQEIVPVIEGLPPNIEVIRLEPPTVAVTMGVAATE